MRTGGRGRVETQSKTCELGQQSRRALIRVIGPASLRQRVWLDVAPVSCRTAAGVPGC